MKAGDRVKLWVGHVEMEAGTGKMLPQTGVLGYKKEEEAREVPSCSGFRGSVVLLTSWFWLCSLYSCEVVCFCCSKSSSLRYFVAMPQKIHYPNLHSE